MAEYLSGLINFQGLGSGTDFSSIIAQLKKIESIPMQRMQVWKADWQARAEAFESVLQTMRDAKAALSLINSRDKFVAKFAFSSKPEIAAISATGKALDGTHSIEVTQLASNAIWSCGVEFAKRTSSVCTQNTEFTYTYKGQTRTLQIAANTSLESFANMVNNDPQNKGIRASIVQSGSTYRLQIQGKDSGADATLSITPTAGLNFLGAPAWRSSRSYTLNDTIWGAGDGAGEFRYTLGFGGMEESIDITNTTEVADLIDLINDRSGPDTAKLEGGRLVISGATSVKGPATAGTIGASYWTSSKYYESSEALTSPEDVAPTFNFSIGLEDFAVDLIPGVSTAQDLVGAINAEYQAQHPGADDVASLVQNANGKYAIHIAGVTSAHGAGINGSSAVAENGLTITPAGTNIITISGNHLQGSFLFEDWVVQAPQNAKFRLDNWPDELESTSNNISGVLDGVTITVFDIGKTQLTIATDTDSVQQNIQAFLDAVNSVRLAIRELSKVDASTSGYNFSVAKKDDNSGTKQVGSVLTGNYGVQLLNSRMKDLAAGMPPGFQKILGNDLFSGDLISSLSQIGIKTVSDKDDPNYGLLVIAPPSTTSGMQDMDVRAFDEALSTKIDALLDFFACDDEGSSSSADFRYASHVKGATKAGTYSVSYTVSYAAEAPNVPIIDVYIDGKKAARDSNMEGYWFTSASGPSAGLAIQIDNLNEGAHSGKVSIKQGKVREMEDFFTAETRGYDSINNTGGALEVLKRNYATIMENIDKRIEREQTRIAQWEQRQKLAFSRLDTLLAQYTANQQRLESEIAKLAQ